MKRFIASIVMIAYMAGAIWFSFSFHYCGGSFHGICFTADTEKDCCGSEATNDGCCEDKIVSAKYKDDHTLSSFAVVLGKALADVALPVKYFQLSAPVLLKSYPVYRHNKGPSPPLLSGVPLYLRLRVLRL